MKINHIADCSNYFGYGTIDTLVVCKSFSWDRDETMDISFVSKYIELNSKKKYIYLITSKTCQYPLTTLDKYWGLWRRVEKEYQLDFVRRNEKKVELNSFCMYFGMAEISKLQIELALQLLRVDPIHSYIILSDDFLDLEMYLDNMLRTFKSGSDCLMDYADIINSECLNNEMVTFIEGNDGSTINYFYGKKADHHEKGVCY